MLASSTQFNAQTLQEQLICPVLLEPLSEAVSLVPCAHKVQQVVAEKMFGVTYGGWLVQSENPCPVCRTSVLGYMTDHSTRNIVKQLFELPESEINEMLALMKKNLAEKSISVEKDVLEKMTYPGKSARFIHDSGDWSLHHPRGDLCRYMNFKSSTKDSLINGFSVLGFNDGDVKICIEFSTKSSKDIQKYLKQFDLIPSLLDLKHSYNSKGKDQLKVFFNILANNNEIPVSHFEMIRDLVAKGTHK
jgi:hypothetical protein